MFTCAGVTLRWVDSLYSYGFVIVGVLLLAALWCFDCLTCRDLEKARVVVF